MAEITIQVLEGLERGRVFSKVPTPVTIGREDDNTIQLNDERVSRFHSKIQEDGDHVILTDLDSTNGTRVNGRPVQLRVLQPGDQLAIGRCLLVYGSAEQIATHLGQDQLVSHQATTPMLGFSDGATLNLPPQTGHPRGLDDHELIDLFPAGPPELPRELGPLQQAQLCDLLSFTHDRIASVLLAALAVEADDEESLGEPGTVMHVPAETWQRLLALEMDLAVLLRTIAEP